MKGKKPSYYQDYHLFNLSKQFFPSIALIVAITGQISAKLFILIAYIKAGFIAKNST